VPSFSIRAVGGVINIRGSDPDDSDRRQMASIHNLLCQLRFNWSGPSETWAWEV